MQPSTALAPQPAAIAPPVRGLPAPPQLGAERIAPLDAARALGVLAMVFGHTCDALLSAAVRAGPLAREYWKVRGLTAPLFLMGSGWAVAVAVERSRARGLPVVRQRLPRVLLLFAIGYALRYPGWDSPGFFSGRPAVWEHVLAFDALHAIAVRLFLASLVFALPIGRRARGLLLVALSALSAGLALFTQAPAGVALPRSLPALALTQALGGSSPFPIAPWTAYFFAGAAIPQLGGAAHTGRTLRLAGVGALLVTLTAYTDVTQTPQGHPALIPFRVGMVLCPLAASAGSLRPGARPRARGPPRARPLRAARARRRPAGLRPFPDWPWTRVPGRSPAASSLLLRASRPEA